MIHAVTDPESHARALRRIERLWNAVPGTPAAAEFDALATLVDTYERRNFPIAPPDPIDAIETRCEELGWSRKELETVLGSRARVSEVLARRRPLSLAMIRRVHAVLGIPAEILITEPKPSSKARARVRSASTRLNDVTAGRSTRSSKLTGVARTTPSRNRAAPKSSRAGGGS
jgi:HTH-type transcriptional regulator/antitoxin HigA